MTMNKVNMAANMAANTAVNMMVSTALLEPTREHFKAGVVGTHLAYRQTCNVIACSSAKVRTHLSNYGYLSRDRFNGVSFYDPLKLGYLRSFRNA